MVVVVMVEVEMEVEEARAGRKGEEVDDVVEVAERGQWYGQEGMGEEELEQLLAGEELQVQ